MAWEVEMRYIYKCYFDESLGNLVMCRVVGKCWDDEGKVGDWEEMEYFNEKSIIPMWIKEHCDIVKPTCRDDVLISNTCPDILNIAY